MFKIKTLKIKFLAFVFLGVPLASTLFTIFTTYFIVEHILGHGNLKIFNDFVNRDGLWIEIILCMQLLVSIFSFFSFKKLFDSGVHSSDFIKEKVWLINSPIILSLSSAFIWISLITLSGYDTLSHNITTEGLTLVIILGFLAGLQNFSLTYFAIDSFIRVKVIPHVLSESELLRLPGLIKVNTFGRFFILAIPSTFIPIILFSFISLSIAHTNNLKQYNSLIWYSIVASLIFVLSLLTTFVRAYKESISRVIKGLKEIYAGNYGEKIHVSSVDELGYLANGFNKVSIELKEKVLIKDTFGKMVSPEVRDFLLEGNFQLGGESHSVTILFSDIRSFTAMSENLSPKEVVEVLNIHFEEMTNLIEKHGGFVNKFIGDAVLAVFGAPVSLENSAQNAISCAKEMRENLENVNTKLSSRGLPQLRIGIGVHSGEVMIGNIGSSSRMEYTVIGDPVNVASRLESLTKEHKKMILISESTADQVDKDKNGLSFVTETPIRGREAKVKVYTL